MNRPVPLGPAVNGTGRCEEGHRFLLVCQGYPSPTFPLRTGRTQDAPAVLLLSALCLTYRWLAALTSYINGSILSRLIAHPGPVVRTSLAAPQTPRPNSSQKDVLGRAAAQRVVPQRPHGRRGRPRPRPCHRRWCRLRQLRAANDHRGRVFEAADGRAAEVVRQAFRDLGHALTVTE